MRRNIIATVKINASAVSLTVLEKFGQGAVEIFNAEAFLADASKFLLAAQDQLGALIGGKLKAVGVVLETTPEVGAKTLLAREKMDLSGPHVKVEDVNTLVAKLHEKAVTGESVPVLVQPLKFDVVGEVTKSYSKAPLLKVGRELVLTAAITIINRAAFEKVHDLMRSVNLEVSQILLMQQALSQSHLSGNALASGAVLIHIGENQTFVTINSNFAVLDSLVFYNFGFANLVSGLVKVFGCSIPEARDILAAHGSFLEVEGDKVVYSRQNGLNEEIFMLSHLQEVIAHFVSRLALPVKQYLVQKNAQDLPVVVSGQVLKINAIDALFKSRLSVTHTSVYNPLTFIEMNERNACALGYSKFITAIDEVLGKQFNTIIETNPNTVLSLKMLGQNRKWYYKLLVKMGGNLDWN